MPKKIKIVRMYKKYLYIACRKEKIYKALAKKNLIVKRSAEIREF